MKKLLSLLFIAGSVMASEPTTQEIEAVYRTGLDKMNSIMQTVIGEKAVLKLDRLEEKKCTPQGKNTYSCTFIPYFVMPNGDTNASKQQKFVMVEKNGKWTKQKADK